MLGRPKNGVVVKISRWVKPKEKLHLSLTNSMDEHVCLQNVGISLNSSQEFQVYLVVELPYRR